MPTSPLGTFPNPFRLHYHTVPAKSMGKSDALSRHPDHDTRDNDNEDQILLPPTIFARSLMIVDLQDQALHQRIKECQALDKDIVQILQAIQANGPSKWKKTLMCMVHISH